MDPNMFNDIFKVFFFLVAVLAVIAFGVGLLIGASAS